MLFKTLSYLNVRFPFPHETFVVASNQFQVMIDFQGAERKTLEEPASEIGLEALCAMVCQECRGIVYNICPNDCLSRNYIL